MKKNLLLYILLGFLVLMNVFFLFKHFSKANDIKPEQRPNGNFIVHELAFDAKQTDQFEKLDAAHRERMKLLFDDIKAAKDRLFDGLTDENVVTTEIDSLARIVADFELQKELETFRFFKAVGAICDEKQKTKLNAIIKAALRRQGRPGQHRPPPRGRGEEGRPPPGGPGDEDRPPPPGH